jgi:catechol 2,3-dioxygenase-like lactoylglutathione lyase family enzyme
MKTNFNIDHIVIMVDDLAAAVADYTSLGFTVLPGGTHEANPTHNALIVFEDGAYIEIIALQPGAEAQMSARLREWDQASPGLVDLALLPGDIEADIAAARERGLTVEDAEPGGRLRPDGQQIAWKTANLKGAGLPFFCADVTPRSLRVPEGPVRQHPNGVTGVADITIAVADLTTSITQYRALLDLEPQPSPSNDALGARTARFDLGETTITLAQPVTGHSPLQAYLAAGGERPYRFSLRTSQRTHAGRLDLSRTHGARIELIAS